MKPSIILLLATLTQPAFGQILFSNRVTGEKGYVTNVDEYFQDAKMVATNANNKFGGDGSLLTGLPASGPPLNGTNAWSGTNSFAKPVTADNLTSTNGFTNQSLTASTAIVADANKKTVSLANGGANTLLHGTTPPAYSSVANADLANSSITVSGGGGVGISGSPVSLGGTVTVGTTTDQRQMASLGLGVAASATSGTATVTNKYDVNRTGSITNVVFGQTGNTNDGIWFPNTNAVSIAINGVEVLTVSNGTVQITGTLTNSGFASFAAGALKISAGGSSTTIANGVVNPPGGVQSIALGSQGLTWASGPNIWSPVNGTIQMLGFAGSETMILHLGYQSAASATVSDLRGCSLSSGTDKAGGDLHIQGGLGRGTGTPGILYLDTTSVSNASGSAAQTITSRVSIGGGGTFTNTCTFDFNTTWLTAMATRGTNTLGRRATFELDLKFVDAVTGTPRAQVAIEQNGTGGALTNTWFCAMPGTISDTITNHYSFRVNPNAVVTVTDVSSGSGASVAISSSQLAQE